MFGLMDGHHDAHDEGHDLLHLVLRAREVAFGLSGGLAVLAGLVCKLLSAGGIGRRGGFAVRDFGEDVVRSTRSPLRRGRASC